MQMNKEKKDRMTNNQATSEVPCHMQADHQLEGLALNKELAQIVW